MLSVLLFVFDALIFVVFLFAFKAAGETVTIAEEMAARDALNRMFKITNSSTTLPFGKKGHVLQLKENLRELPQSSTSTIA